MKIYFSPIVGLENTINYEFSKESITITVDGVSDVFDFTGIPDGSIDITSIETILPLNPLVEAEKKDGILFIKLLNPITKEATELEKFPEWVEVGEDNGEV